MKFKFQKSTVLALVAIGALSILAVLALKPSRNAVVYVTRDGFYPATVTIPVGGKVTWVVRDQQNLHWPASNNHPSHTNYSEVGGCIGSRLDACQGLKDGERFEFVFTKEGSWGIHDHLSPGLAMTVNVSNRAGFGPLPSSKISAADFRKLDYQKQQKTLSELTAKDPSKGWELLKSVFLVNGQVVGNAHSFAHVVGNQVYNKSGLDGIKICDSSFGYGCFHGVTEEAIRKQGTIVAKIQDACLAAFTSVEADKQIGCIHGMGHGLLSRRVYDIKAALTDCAPISNQYRTYCHDGVFMEYATGTAKVDMTKEDPWRLCNDIGADYDIPCARYEPHLLMSRVGLDFKAVGEACQSAPRPALKDNCYSSLGFLAAQGSPNNPEQVRQTCLGLVNSAGQVACIIAAATEVTFEQYQGWEQAVTRLCDSLQGSDRDRCKEGSRQELARQSR